MSYLPSASVLNVDWPNLLTLDESSAWYAALCKHPAVFHGFVYATAAHQDILSSQLTRSSRKDMLTHKAKAFRSLRDLTLQATSDAEIELLLFAVMVMWHYDLQDEQIAQDEILQFSPHMPGANWLSVYGRTQGVEAHTRPLWALVARLGGVQKLKMPGLAFSLSW